MQRRVSFESNADISLGSARRTNAVLGMNSVQSRTLITVSKVRVSTAALPTAASKGRLTQMGRPFRSTCCNRPQLAASTVDSFRALDGLGHPPFIEMPLGKLIT